MEKNYHISGDIYPHEKIQQGILDFIEVADIILQGELIVINSDGTEEEIDEIFLELMNYILSI